MKPVEKCSRFLPPKPILQNIAPENARAQENTERVPSAGNSFGRLPPRITITAQRSAQIKPVGSTVPANTAGKNFRVIRTIPIDSVAGNASSRRATKRVWLRWSVTSVAKRIRSSGENWSGGSGNTIISIAQESVHARLIRMGRRGLAKPVEMSSTSQGGESKETPIPENIARWSVISIATT